MHDCEFMIGNSSSGIIESMLYKKPAINILPRKLGRIQLTKMLLIVKFHPMIFVKDCCKQFQLNLKKIIYIKIILKKLT